MLASFDRINIMKPPEIDPDKQEIILPWPHSDQSPKKAGFHCAQGLVTLEDVGPNEGTLIVYKGSHLLHEKYFIIRGRTTISDFAMIPSNDKWFQENGCEIVRVTAPKGSVILWDSRTIHYNGGAILPREVPRFRIVAYICMTPRKLVKDKDILWEKIQAFKGKESTTHWPHEVVIFPRDSYVERKYKVSKELAKLTPLGRRLIGCDTEVDLNK
jgi:hypothetical protein